MPGGILMDGLASYHLADFIPFGLDAYGRLFASHNADCLPAAVIGPLLGGLALWAARRGRGRWLGLLLALAWGWLGWAWYARSYAVLNWAGARMAWMAYAQAAVMALMAGRGWLGVPPDDAVRRVGLALAAAGLVLYPLLDPLGGRMWAGVEVFGHAPEPTAIATLGLVLAAGRWRGLGLLVPTLVCVEGAATAWVLAIDGWWIPLATAGLAWTALAVAARSGPGGWWSSRRRTVGDGMP